METFEYQLPRQAVALIKPDGLLTDMEIEMKRRDLLKTLAAGVVGAGIPGTGYSAGNTRDIVEHDFSGHGKKATFEKVTAPSDVGLVKGEDGRDNTFKALKSIEDKVMADLDGKKRILIKPNFVVVDNPLAATSVESVRGILDFIRPRFKGSIEIGESSTAGGRGYSDGTESSYDGFRNYGYLPLEKEYGVKLVDLNLDSTVNHFILNSNGNKPQRIRIISKFLDKDMYLVSAGKMKTHNCVLVTLSLKNILMAAPVNDYKTSSDKALMHCWDLEHFSKDMMDARTKDVVLHYNLFQLSQIVYPDLGVVDAFTAMEGDGPVEGTPVECKLALASTDPLALDTLGTKIMGFDPTEIMYLSSMNEAGLGQGDLDKINVVGANLEECLFKFKPHHIIARAYGLG